MNREKWKALIKTLAAVAILAAFFVAAYFTCRHFNLTSVDGIRSFISGCGTWTWLAYLGTYVLLTVLLCAVPGTSMTLIMVGVALFGADWKTFLLCFSGVIIASVCMDLIGRFGGAKVIRFIVGEKTYDEAQGLLKEKGTVYTPVMYLLPLFPDDAICMCCGALRVNFWIHLAEIVLCRGIGCATIVFGINLIPWSEMTSVYDYIVCGTVITFWVVMLVAAARKIDKKLSERRRK